MSPTLNTHADVSSTTPGKPPVSPPTPDEFKKQPVSDSEALSSDGGADRQHPVSLLSSMLSDHSASRKAAPSAASGYTSALSASSSPSTALSSPRTHEDPVSILRHGSFGSDGEQFYLPLSKAVPLHSAQLLETTTPAPAATLRSDELDLTLPATATADQTAKTKPPQHRALKFAVANRPTAELERPLALDADGAGDVETEDEDADPGYEEDSEDGFSDDEPGFMYKAHNMLALARATSDSRPSPQSASTSPPSRVSPPPPPRRGRGHVRVDPAADQDHNHCTRHYSPPPSEARSTPPPGPRDGRAGSPLPSPVEDDDDDDDEDDDDDDNDDDGDADAEADGTGNLHDMPGKDDDDAEQADAESNSPPAAASVGTGMRDMLRRASEHLSSFRRPSFTAPIPEDAAVVLDDDTSDTSRVLLARARSLGTRTERGKMRTLSAGEAVLRSQPVACPGRRLD